MICCHSVAKLDRAFSQKAINPSEWNGFGTFYENISDGWHSNVKCRKQAEMQIHAK